MHMSDLYFIGFFLCEKRQYNTPVKHLADKRESQHASVIRPQIECFVVVAFIFVKFIVKCLSSEWCCVKSYESPSEFEI